MPPPAKAVHGSSQVSTGPTWLQLRRSWIRGSSGWPFVFALVGYGTKAGPRADAHVAARRAQRGAVATSAMLSGVSLKIALYALLRFHILTAACLGPAFSCHLLLGFGLLSMFLAAPFILVQENLKRMLAYSSLEHVG